MIWNDHSKLVGNHALLSPSGYHWLYYEDDEQLFNKYRSVYSQKLGTVLHEYAEKRIRYKMKLKKNEENSVLFYLLDNDIPRSIIDMNRIYVNLMNYINDAIGFRMDPEVILYYSLNCFGTADAISFKNNELRIHDLKTGTTPVHKEQLEIYAALFCLEYDKRPEDLTFELRLYQSEEMIIDNPTGEEIRVIMDKIKDSSSVIDIFKE